MLLALSRMIVKDCIVKDCIVQDDICHCVNSLSTTGPAQQITFYLVHRSMCTWKCSSDCRAP
jgi:hypothetical protein